MPCSEKCARKLFEANRARVHRRYPFTIRIVDRCAEDSTLQDVDCKIDPGSKTTGLAIVRKAHSNKSNRVLWLGELEHRGAKIRHKLKARAAFRRRRRNSNLRYRQARFNNRIKPKGWLAPSLWHRVETTISWITRLRRFTPITGIATELVRFDMQLMQHPDISGVEYQQGELAGHEIKEYLLGKWGRACAYCGVAGVPLQTEHIVPKARSGSNRPSNLTVACRSCNESKGAQTVEQFLADQPKVLARIKTTMRNPLRDAAAVNSTRWALFHALKATGLQVECGTGGRTKWNRSRLGIPKSNALDAACVGVTETLIGCDVPKLAIKAMGRGACQRTRLKKCGFPRGYLMRKKVVRGFRTGDIVKAVVPTGKKAGTHIGRVAVRASGSFKIQTVKEVLQGVNAKHCTPLARGDGYNYALA